MSAPGPVLTVYRIALSQHDCPGFYLTADADTQQLRMLPFAQSDTLQKWFVKPLFVANHATAAVITNEQTGTSLKRNGVKEPIELVAWHEDSNDTDFLWCQQPAPESNFNRNYVLLSDPYIEVALDAALVDHCVARQPPIAFPVNRTNNQYWQFQTT